MLQSSSLVEQVGLAQQDVHAALEEAGEIGQPVISLTFGEEIGDVGDQPIIVPHSVVRRNKEGQVMDCQYVAVRADSQGRTGNNSLGNTGVGAFVGQGQPRPGGFNGTGIVKDHFADSRGNSIGLKVPDKDFPEVGIVLVQVIEVIGLEGYAQPFGEAIQLVGTARVGEEQQLAPPLHKIHHQVSLFPGVRLYRRNDQKGVGLPELVLHFGSAGLGDKLDGIAPVGHPGQQGSDFGGVKGVAVGIIHQQGSPAGCANRVAGKDGPVGKVRRDQGDGNYFLKGNVRRIGRRVTALVKEKVRYHEKGNGKAR